MEERNGKRDSWRVRLTRMSMFVKRQIKLNRFLLVINIKRGVSISALVVIVRSGTNKTRSLPDVRKLTLEQRRMRAGCGFDRSALEPVDGLWTDEPNNE